MPVRRLRTLAVLLAAVLALHATGWLARSPLPATWTSRPTHHAAPATSTTLPAPASAPEPAGPPTSTDAGQAVR